MDDFGHPQLPWPGEGEKPRFKFVTKEINGKPRFVGKPNNDMTRLQEEFVELLKTLIKNSARVSFESATGALPGTSAMENAIRHSRNRYFYCLDLRDAFPNVNLTMLTVALFGLAPELAGTTRQIEAFLNRYCMSPRGGLVVGSPSSPLLFNIYCAVWIDPFIRKLFGSLHTTFMRDVEFTRFIDDFVISSNEPLSLRIRQGIHEVVRKAGFTVKHRKSKNVKATIVRPVTVTGVQMFSDLRTRPTGKFRLKVNNVLQQPTLAMTDKEREAYENKLVGMLGHLRSFKLLNLTDETLPLIEALEKRVRELRRLRRTEKKWNKRKHSSKKLGRFTPGFLDELIARAPLEQVVRKKVVLRRFSGGKEWVGLCPFHNEKTPSFTVATQKRFFHCFGCGEHGNAITFIMRAEGMDFPKAVRTLAGWCGIAVP